MSNKNEAMLHPMLAAHQDGDCFCQRLLTLAFDGVGGCGGLFRLAHVLIDDSLLGLHNLHNIMQCKRDSDLNCYTLAGLSNGRVQACGLVIADNA